MRLSKAPLDTSPARTVVIVGGGVSGVAVAMHLLRRAEPDLRIVLVERGPSLGHGVAYGVESEVFRLNVPASKMSLDPDVPDDFVAWSSAEAAPHAFLPRARYGKYVVDRLHRAIQSRAGTLQIIRGDAVRVDSDAVLLSNGTRLAANVVVLATGVQPRPAPSALPDDARIVDAWNEGALASLPPRGELLVLGAGLTALDVIAFLDAKDFSGHLTLLSRRGLLPRPHLSPLRVAASAEAELAQQRPESLRELLVWGRKVVRAAEARGEPWQCAIDAIRPHTSRLWRDLPPSDRVRFVRSVRPYWEVLRHRAPVDVRALVDRGRSSGRIDVVAGSVMTCAPRIDALDVDVRPAGGARRRHAYHAIVRCIGPALQRPESDTPILRDLIESGRAAEDPAGLGICTDHEGRLLGYSGDSSPAIFVMGALRRASSWETTSVPDIAVHALALAKRIAAPDFRR